MRTISCPSSANYPPRHHRRFTVACCCIIVLVAISTVDTVSAKPFPASHQASPNTMITQRRSAQDKYSGGRSAPLMEARGGTNDDDEAAGANESIDNTKHQPSTDAPPAAAATATATATTTNHTNPNWKAKIRNVVFPIYGEELTKFLLIGTIKFFVILALTITRDNKDTMVVTECGAEAIAFLKVRLSLLRDTTLFNWVVA